MLYIIFLISFKNLFKSLFRLIVVDFMKNLISRDRKCVANDPTKTMLLNVFKWIFNFQDQPRKRNPKIWYPPNAQYLRNYFQECCIKELNVHNVCSCPIKLKGKHQCFISLFAITMFYCILSYFKCNVKCNSRNGLRGSHWLSWLFLDCTCNNYA